jgi:hypothetical protein
MSSNQVSVRGFFDGPCRLPDPVPIPVPRRKPGMFGTTLTSIVGRGGIAGLLSIVMGLALMSAQAGAQAYEDSRRQIWRNPGWATTADGRLVDVQVEVGGRATPLYTSPRHDARLYFQAVKRSNYGIRLTNQTGERVGVLLTVDGLNVINGNLSSQSRHEPMYVLDPYESTVIRGWRSSLDEVRKFVFVDEQRSYAERTGQGNGDLGWLRVTTFREAGGWQRFKPQTGRDRDEFKQHADGQRAPESAMPPMAELHGGDDARSGPTANDAAPGTGWGERRTDRVTETVFTAALQPTDKFVLRYEYASGLRALGITPVNGSRVRERDRGQYGFAQPPGW